jgi:hypothetical protein
MKTTTVVNTSDEASSPYKRTGKHNKSYWILVYCSLMYCTVLYFNRSSTPQQPAFFLFNPHSLFFVSIF